MKSERSLFGEVIANTAKRTMQLNQRRNSWIEQVNLHYFPFDPIRKRDHHSTEDSRTGATFGENRYRSIDRKFP